MRKLVSLLLALAMILALVPTAMADDAYTLDIYWVGNGDNEAVRAGVEVAAGHRRRPVRVVEFRGEGEAVGVGGRINDLAHVIMVQPCYRSAARTVYLIFINVTVGTKVFFLAVEFIRHKGLLLLIVVADLNLMDRTESEP